MLFYRTENKKKLLLYLNIHYFLSQMTFVCVLLLLIHLSLLCFSEKIENVLSVDYIRSLKFLSMVQFESQIWRTFGHKYIAASDRAKVISMAVLLFPVFH